MQLRVATARDARALAEIKVAAWRQAYAGLLEPALLASLTVEAEEATWREAIRQFPAVFRVAEDGEGVVGYAITGATDGEPGVGELFAIYVHPARWGHGVGKALMATALEDLRAAPFGTAILWVLERNVRSRGFYERHGFAADGRRRPELGTWAVRYQRPL